MLKVECNKCGNVMDCPTGASARRKGYVLLSKATGNHIPSLFMCVNDVWDYVEVGSARVMIFDCVGDALKSLQRWAYVRGYAFGSNSPRDVEICEVEVVEGYGRTVEIQQKIV